MTQVTNPVLNADWPDPDVIRVGDDYYLVASSFNRAPGLPVLHSTDLVSWEIVANALRELPPVEHYAVPRHGGGVWAPSLRLHQGTYFIVYPDPDYGIAVLTAPDPRGEWSLPHLLIAGRGLIDPCPLWDDDGRTYLVHAWAMSRSGLNNRLTVVEVSEDLRLVIGAPRTVVDGGELSGYRTLEGPKFYKHDGWYWIFAPAGGVATGWQSVFRSRSPYGPYEGRVVLAQGDTAVNGPHQGAWVDTPTGENWFLHFQDRGVFGRVVHLQPMTWGTDGWPRIGAPRADGRGEPMLTTPVPHVVAAQVRVDDVLNQREPNRSDDFAGTSLGPQWHWQANPHQEWARLPGDGTLHLAVRAVDRGNLRELPSVLTQQLPGGPSEVTTSLSLDSAAPGARAGLVVLGRDYAWIGLEQAVTGLHLVCRRMGTANAEDGMTAPTVLRRSLDSARGGPIASVRATTDAIGLVTFSWSIDGRATWHQLELPFQAAAGQWIGAEIGLFACAPVAAGGQRGEDTQGSAVFRAVEFAVKPASDAAGSASDEGTS
jgi:beta-xylosidase